MILLAICHAKEELQQVFKNCHKWRSGFYRTRGERCPYCRGQRASKQNNLTLYPEIAKQLDRKKNGGIGPKDVTPGSHKYFVWKCNKGPDHEWSAKVVDRVRDQLGCPFCSNRKLSVTNMLSKKYPKVAAQWHPSRNQGIRPNQVTYATRTKYYWRCIQGHEWSTAPYNRTVREQGCRECDNQSRRR